VAAAPMLGNAVADATPNVRRTVDFHGEHQAGISTAVQDRLFYGAFDLLGDDAGELRTLLQDWTVAAEKLTAGVPIGSPEPENSASPPVDTGEALGLVPAELTITVGVGRPVFVRPDGSDRMGLAARLPPPLVALPTFKGDVLDDFQSGGDISLQCCSNDPQIAFHAFHNLARIARGRAAVRWTQLGFGRTSTTTAGAATPRNLMGFKDGTNNIKSDDAKAMADFVWAGARDDPAWMHGGTYVVVRRIRMLLEAWDRTAIGEQERVIGRSKVIGAPNGSTREHATPNLEGTDPDGKLRIDTDAHIRLAAPSHNRGIRILRRGYSFSDGIDQRTAELDAGLFFIAYQRDPRSQFVPLQEQLSAGDALNEYIKHVGSGIFAVLPGVRPGEALGDPLFES
jgi:deferrochelatase/peroxidase EfeB